jgi:hypothetical protein
MLENFFISRATKISSMKPIITQHHKATTPVSMAGKQFVLKENEVNGKEIVI